MITLKNDFHNTECRIRPGAKSRAQVRRIRRKLCPYPDCTCGGNLGERGSQRQPDGRQIMIEPASDGGYEIACVS